MKVTLEPDAGGGGPVRVLARGLTVLRVFTPANRWLSNHEIAAAALLPRPTVSRITAPLTSLGYLDYSSRTGRYRLGNSVLTLGFHALANLDIHLIARPYMQQLADEVDALVVLSSRDGLAMVCNEVCHGNNILTLRVSVGSRLSLPNSAMGRALIGTMEPARRANLLDLIRNAVGEEWSRIEAAFPDAESQMLKKGFYTSIGTLELGVNGVGTILETRNAPHTYALGVAGPAFRFPMESLESDIGPRLLATRDRIQRRLQEAQGQDS